MRARQGKPPVWFSRIDVLQEEDGGVGRLALGLAAQAALASGHGFSLLRRTKTFGGSSCTQESKEKKKSRCRKTPHGRHYTW